VNFKIIVAEDEDITRKHVLNALKREGFEVVGAKDGREALERIEQERFDVLITDVKMPEMSGIELLEKVKENYYGIEVLIITGFGSIDSAVEAMKKGAYEYITKPFNLDELILKVKHIHERKNLKRENVALKAYFGMNKGVSVIARSESMREIMDTIERIKDSDCDVLLAGERGVGKSLLARIIHHTSKRQGMPFLSVNCAVLTEELLAGELFGHEKGSVTSDLKNKWGLLEIADAGTVFLDEVAEMPYGIQSRLLAALENGIVSRTGGGKPIAMNVRLLAATNKNLKDQITEGKFIEDLYYRVNGVEFLVPPLRERREDIEPLSTHFLLKHLPESAKDIGGFEKESLDLLMHYSFPGNVRELENIIERAIILEKGRLITPESLPRSIRIFQIETFCPQGIMTIDELTKSYAQRVLEAVGNNKGKAAELLGISEIDLWKILKRK